MNYSYTAGFLVTYISPIAIDISHIISDICFIFYTKNIPGSNFTDVFIYLHAVTGVIGSILAGFYFFLFLPIWINMDEADIRYYNFILIERFLRILGITITLIWTPIVQMLNMSLLSGNDYY